MGPGDKNEEISRAGHQHQVPDNEFFKLAILSQPEEGESEIGQGADDKKSYFGHRQAGQQDCFQEIMPFFPLYQEQQENDHDYGQSKTAHFDQLGKNKERVGRGAQAETKEAVDEFNDCLDRERESREKNNGAEKDTLFLAGKFSGEFIQQKEKDNDHQAGKEKVNQPQGINFKIVGQLVGQDSITEMIFKLYSLVRKVFDREHRFQALGKTEFGGGMAGIMDIDAFLSKSHLVRKKEEGEDHQQEQQEEPAVIEELRPAENLLHFPGIKNKQDQP